MISRTPTKRVHKNDSEFFLEASVPNEASPPKNPKLGNENVENEQQTPSPSRLLYKMDALGSALSHYFSPKKRSPGRPAARKLQLAPTDSEGSEDEKETQSKQKQQRVPVTSTVRPHCEFSSIKHCFGKLNDHLPGNISAHLNTSTLRKIFAEWACHLDSGEFNLLIHGLGSKRRVLEDFSEFIRQRIGKEVVVIDGLNRNAAVQKIFERISTDFSLEKVRKRGMRLEEWSRALGAAIANADLEMVIIVHSIDAPQLRSREQQSALALLVKQTGPAVRIVASVDHVNASQLWDQSSRDTFSWLYYPLSTFHCYSAEVMASETKLLGLDARSAAKGHTMASLDAFWNATTANVHKILAQLVIHAPTLAERSRREPLNIPKFCQILKNEFATTSETVLRQQLIEFQDHRLIQMDRDANIQLVVDRQLLSAFLNTKFGIDD